MTAYARYLLAVKIGRYLTEDEEADHIDNDGTNDSIDNIQILSVEEHRLKTLAFTPTQAVSKLTCSVCNKEFLRTTREVKSRKSKRPCCSFKCSSKLPRTPPNTGSRPKITKEELLLVYYMRESGITIENVEKRTGISRCSIVRWMKRIKSYGLNPTLDELT